MPLVKFVGTTGLTAGVTVITLKNDEEGSRELVLDGDAVEVSGKELAQLSSMFALEVQGDDETDEPAPVADAAVTSSAVPQVSTSAATPQPSTPPPAAPPRTA